MIGVRWIYVFYRGDDVDFVGDLKESMLHYRKTADHVKWLATPTAQRRAEAQPESRKLFALKVDPESNEEGI